MSTDRLSAAVDMARAEIETLRWILLAALWHARPYGCTEYVLLRAAQDVPLRVTPDMVRAELDSLAMRGLLTLNREEALWWAKLAPLGEDVVQYREPAPKGVARPPRW